MKKLFLLFTVVISIQCFSQDWHPIVFGTDMTVSANLSSITRTNDKIYVWLKFEYTKEGKDERIKTYKEILPEKKWTNFNYNLFYYVFDAKNKKMQVLSSIYYDTNGKVIYSFDEEESEYQFSRLVPETAGMSMLNALNEKTTYEVNGTKYEIYIEKMGKFLEKYPDAKLLWE
jgi:hypothetical protein